MQLKSFRFMYQSTRSPHKQYSPNIEKTLAAADKVVLLDPCAVKLISRRLSTRITWPCYVIAKHKLFPLFSATNENSVRGKSVSREIETLTFLLLRVVVGVDLDLNNFEESGFLCYLICPSSIHSSLNFHTNFQYHAISFESILYIQTAWVKTPQ